MRDAKQVSLLLVVVQCCLVVQGIKIAAYNVRVFGTTKLRNEVTMDIITQVYELYLKFTNIMWLRLYYRSVKSDMFQTVNSIYQILTLRY